MSGVGLHWVWASAVLQLHSAQLEVLPSALVPHPYFFLSFLLCVLTCDGRARLCHQMYVEAGGQLG